MNAYNYLFFIRHIAARTVLPTLKRFEDGIWYSRNFEFLLRPLVSRLLDFFSLSSIMTQDQGLPRTVYVKLGQAIYNYYVDMLDAGIRMEGADNLVRDLFTLVMKAIEENFPTISTTSPGIISEIQHMQNMILHDDDIMPRPIEKTRGYMFTKAFGNELGVIRIDADSVEKFLEKIATKLVLLGESSKLSIVPILLIRQEVQTMMGLPTSLVWSSMTMTSVQAADSKLNTPTTLWGKDITLRCEQNNSKTVAFVDFS